LSGLFGAAILIYGSACYQVIGAVLGVKLIRTAFPQVGKGAALSVGVHHGALAEGLATLLVVMVSVTLKKKEKGFFMKTWIASIWKMTIHILSSDSTGGIMNPASVSAFYTYMVITDLETDLLDLNYNTCA
jgi:aquaporin SIP